MSGDTIDASDSFPTVSTESTVAFLIVFSLACFSTILMLMINIYKSLMITREQKSIFKEVAIKKNRDKSFKPDLLIEVGIPLDNQSTTASSQSTNSNSSESNRTTGESKKDK